MKKLTTVALTAATYLSLAVPAFAQTKKIETCPEGQFAALCRLDAEDLGSLIQGGVTLLLIAATIISLFFLIWGGIRWVTSGGDKAKVEEARKTIVSAIVGLVIAFLAYFILTVVLSLFNISLNNLQLPKLIK